MSETPVVAVAGAGFAGTMVAVQLAQRARVPLVVRLYDAAGGFARGVAYGTKAHPHLLNMTADRMGAFAERPDDFYRWLLAHESTWRSKYPALAGLRVTPQSFIPRLLYGDYTASLLAQALENSNGVTVEKVAAEVIDAEPGDEGLLLTLGDGTRQKAERLVLALGNLFAGKLAFEQTVLHHPRYVGNIWSPPAGSILDRADLDADDEPILIIGSGLTMVDMLLSLRERGYRGKVIAVSRHGLLPQPHIGELPPHPPFLPVDSAPRTGRELIKAIRREAKSAQAAGSDWRAVIDALRPTTWELWANLPEAEQRRLVRVLPYWSTHRHRMAPTSAEFIARETERGTFESRTGRIDAVRPKGERLVVELRTRGRAHEIEAAHVLNCAGPGVDILKSGSVLLRSVHARGLITQGPLAMGIGADADGRAKGAGGGRIFALGPLLTGERLETIAVPELRKQAEVTASAILTSFREAEVALAR